VYSPAGKVVSWSIVVVLSEGCELLFEELSEPESVDVLGGGFEFEFEFELEFELEFEEVSEVGLSAEGLFSEVEESSVVVVAVDTGTLSSPVKVVPPSPFPTEGGMVGKETVEVIGA
jgi:hypothetical protein